MDDQGRTEGPEEKLRRAADDFSRSWQEVGSRLSAAVESLSSEFSDAIKIFREEQHAVLRRQEDLSDEARRAMELAQSHAERASSAATETAAGQQRSTDLINQLEREREGLGQLIDDLRGRIAALTVLTAPLPTFGSERPSSQTGTPESSSQPLSWEGQTQSGGVEE